MIHQIVEAFTRPHYQVTAIDELVQAAVVLFIVGTIVGIIMLTLRNPK